MNVGCYRETIAYLISFKEARMSFGFLAAIHDEPTSMA